MLTPRAVAKLCDESKFLAVNTQSNAGNQGFNPISKYPRADYVCLAMHEIQMETRMREGAWRDLILEVTQRIDCKRFTVTRGSAGSIHYASDGGFTESPSLALHVADRVGAGDAVLALTSLLVSIDVPWDIVGFIGNVAGAHMVTDLGNRNPLNKIALSKNIISLMK
jgi:sugar/nucleoside kinase (ribokinase family)